MFYLVWYLVYPQNSLINSFRLFRLLVVKCFPNVCASGWLTNWYIFSTSVLIYLLCYIDSWLLDWVTPWHVDVANTFMFSTVMHTNTVIHLVHLLNDRIRTLPLSQELVTICYQHYQYLFPNIKFSMACNIVPCFLYLLCFLVISC